MQQVPATGLLERLRFPDDYQAPAFLHRIIKSVEAVTLSPVRQRRPQQYRPSAGGARAGACVGAWWEAASAWLHRPLSMSRMGADNDGSDHNYRQRIDNVYQIRADKKADLKSKFPLLVVRVDPP